MKNLIAANWKMNPQSQKEAKKLFDGIKKKAKAKNVEVVVCPPFVYLPLFKGLPIGAQNIYFEEKGAFTGEVSAAMLKDAKASYVILGHSERRKYFVETNEQINKKIKKALSFKIKPIFCIGETKEEKDQNKKSEVLEAQLTEGLKSVTKEEMKSVSVAYEPVWAIGTGNNCSVEETMGTVLFIRKILTKLYNREVADNTRILYGGSVKSNNAAAYIKEAGANGLLVGGASLNAEEFAKIVKSAS